MFSTFANAWKTPELRKKIIFTCFIILIFRIGSYLPVPFLDAEVMGSLISESGSIFSVMNTFSGGALAQGSVFALSIQPYINASIIMQLLTYALPPLETMQKEGESGRKKIQKITNFVSLAIATAMGYAFYISAKNLNAVQQFTTADGAVNTFANIFTGIIIVAVFVAGSQLINFMGNLVNDKGLGNGISIILFAGILARGPLAIINMFEAASATPTLYMAIFFIAIFFVVMVGFIVFMNESERRIPVQYAKRVVGRRQYGGQSSFIPIKIAMSGVMPIIFAMALMSFPATIKMFVAPAANPQGFWQNFYVGFLNFFNTTSVWYAILYFILIIAFNFFYVSMQYDPIQIANQLRNNNGGVPGIRPGKPTSDYIRKILNKITIVGAFFLGVIAIVPILSNYAVSGLQISMGGTTILIVVSVILETTRMLESQMMMRHHKGFLE